LQAFEHLADLICFLQGWADFFFAQIIQMLRQDELRFEFRQRSQGYAQKVIKLLA